MVSRGGGDDTCTSLIRIETGKNVYGAPQFKATRMLEIFHLKPDLRSDKGR
ncbi:ABC transporter substrate-binding protein [Pantoea sp. S62]|nr:ABC transporter substrate-binding protein [Pantoea sp. S62]